VQIGDTLFALRALEARCVQVQVLAQVQSTGPGRTGPGPRAPS
jgi:hypothetical protein